MAPPQPTRVRDYQIQKVLARGGMATVYLADDLKHNRQVALKQILPHIAEDKEFISRFRHEVLIHSQLRHPNILELIEFGDGPTDYFIAMEYIDGGTLKFLLDRVRKFPTELALFITREVLAGLASAHARGIIHRDIKPHNVMITRTGQVKVGDFGISKTDQMTRLTQTGELIGTPAYMSPEQASGNALDARSDIFSTGVMLYEMLAGTNPFFTGNPATTIRKIVDFNPEGLFEVDPTIPIECEALVNRMIAKNPDQRFMTAATAVEAVDARLESFRLGDPTKNFQTFLQQPQKYIQERREKLAKAHLERGKKLLESQASPEVALWEIFQAHKTNEQDAEASELMATISNKTGYKLAEGPENPKIKELEEKLKLDPENIPLLLQLAKLYKLEKDFVNMMRFFLKLKSVEVDDAYVQGQIASLVAMPGAAAPAARPAGAGRAPAPVRPGGRPSEVPKLSQYGLPKPAIIGGLIGVVLLLTLGIVKLIRSAKAMDSSDATAGVAPLAAEPTTIDRTAIKGDAGTVLERARKVAASGDNAAAIDLLKEWEGKNAGHESLPLIQLELARLHDHLGQIDLAIARYGQVALSGRAEALQARAECGDLLLRAGRYIEAEEQFRALLESGATEWAPRARLEMGRLARRNGEQLRAVEHLEELIARYPQHELANEARLEVAQIRLSEQNYDQAERLATEVRNGSKIGGDVYARAGQLLSEISSARASSTPSPASSEPPPSTDFGSPSEPLPDPSAATPPAG